MQDIESQPKIFNNEEVPPAIEELFSFPGLHMGMKSLFPESLTELILKEKDKVRSIFDFQKYVVYPIIKWIQKGSITGLTADGLEHIKPDDRYLFISNHKDIVLDSALLNMVLFERDLPTSQIAIGDNLMKHRISELIFKINKSFVVKRTGTAVELYQYSVKLSQYISDLITQKMDSVWIAQREGRSKDGNDRTQPGLLKMLSLSNKGDLKTFFQQLNIIPVAISYEYDPCDLLKTQEYLKKKTEPEYKKEFDEDVESMLLGLRGPKGRVHFHFGKPLKEELEVFDTLPNAKKQLEVLAQIIDKAIHLHYELHPVNYIASDLLHQSNQYAGLYTLQASQYLEEKMAQLSSDPTGEGREYFLAMYANPLINQKSY